MPLILSGDTGISGVDGSAGTPSLQGTDSNTGVFYATDIVGIATNGTERMRIDSSGNVGIGVTPSPWSNFKVLQISSIGALAAHDFGSGNTQVRLISNAYWDGANFRYITSNTASMYSINDRQHIWSSSASGTAGNSISFTESMRIDSSGNLLVGTASGSALVAAGRGLVEINGSTDSVYSYKANNNLVGYSLGSASEMRLASFTAIPLTFYTNATERMRISAGGAIVGIGTSSPSSVAGQSLQLGNRSAAFQLDVNGDLYTSHNMYYDGANWRYMVSGEASMTDFGNGRVNFFRAASGTSGATVTLIPTLTIDNSDATSVILQKGTLTFPSTQNPSANANTLDDYEEGTWTPTVAFNGNAVGVTYAQQRGNYTKIGNRVFISMYLRLSNKGSSSGNLAILGLPFTSVNSSDQYNNIAVWINSASGISGSMQGYNSPNSSAINELAFVGTGAQTVVNNGNITNSTDFMVNFSYSI